MLEHNLSILIARNIRCVVRHTLISLIYPLHMQTYFKAACWDWAHSSVVEDVSSIHKALA